MDLDTSRGDVMKKYYWVFLLILLTACGSGGTNPVVTPTATPNPGEIALQMMQQQMAANATEQSVGLQFTATAQVQGVTATQEMLMAQAAWTEQALQFAAATESQRRADVRATQQKLDIEASATHEVFMAYQAATERSFFVTGTAALIGTQTAYPQTAVAQSIHATQTEQAWQTTATMDAAYGVAQATAAFANAQSVEFAVQRERVTNMTRAWVPWMGFIIALGVLSVIGIRASRMRVIPKDAFGAMPGLLVDGVVTDMDNGTTMQKLSDGKIEWTQMNEKVTERNQKVQLVRALPAGRPEIADKVFNFNEERRAPVIEVIEPGTMSRSMLNDIQDQVVEED
jgi:hypothetical protein